MNILDAVLTVVLTLLGAFLGTWLKEYLSSAGKKDGEIAAIRRNLDEVLRQQRETTRVTEEIRHTVSHQLAHDRELFGRYDELLPEPYLRYALEADLYAKYSNTKFTGRLFEFKELARSEGGQFLSEPVREAFAACSAKIAELHLFISTHFFTRTIGQQADSDGSISLELYPEYKHVQPKPGRPDWDARAKELDDLCEAVDAAYKAFRRSAREHLSV